MEGCVEAFPFSIPKLLLYCTLICCMSGFHCKRLDESPGWRMQELQLTSTTLGGRESDSSPHVAPQPSLSGPLSLVPFKNNSVPKLSGVCPLNFSDARSMMSTTSINCWGSFAHYMASVTCCPQLHATLTFLMGKLSMISGSLVLDESLASHCLSDIQQLLSSQGANEDLMSICSIRASNLSEASCPVKNVTEFENKVDTVRLLGACKTVDPVTECCTQICQNEIFDAATTVATTNRSMSSTHGTVLDISHFSKADACKEYVLRWLASRLNQFAAKQVLRRISNCKLNTVCPLAFPDVRHLAKYCSKDEGSQTACCNAVESYISHLQRQSFITNLQALNCAALLRGQLLKVNITENVYDLCRVTLKDFSLQVGSQESGCLLPSLPSDLTFDKSSGVSFNCDLNDDIAAPWLSMSPQSSMASCNRSVHFPELPSATPASNFDSRNDVELVLVWSSIALASGLLYGWLPLFS